MNSARIAVRYARALFGLALDSGVVDAVYHDMKSIGQICSLTEVRELIINPVIPPQVRKRAVMALAGDDAAELTLKFIELMFDQGRGDHLADAARNYIDLTRRHRGIRRVTVTTAVPVGDETKREIAELIADGTRGAIEFEEVVDQALIGGFTIRVDDSYLDASVRSRLNRFRKEFLLAGYRDK